METQVAETARNPRGMTSTKSRRNKGRGAGSLGKAGCGAGSRGQSRVWVNETGGRDRAGKIDTSATFVQAGELAPSDESSKQEKIHENQLLSSAQEFVCGICQEFVVGCGPVLTSCSHLFCGDCFDRWTEACPIEQSWAERLDSRAGLADEVSVPCPACGESLDLPGDLSPISSDSQQSTNLVLWRMLSSLKVACKNHSKVRGNGCCDWVGEYGEYQSHARACQNCPVPHTVSSEVGIGQTALKCTPSEGTEDTSSAKTITPESPSSPVSSSPGSSPQWSPETSEPFRAPLSVTNTWNSKEAAGTSSEQEQVECVDSSWRLDGRSISALPPPQWGPKVAMFSCKSGESLTVEPPQRNTRCCVLDRTDLSGPEAETKVVESELPCNSLKHLISLLSEINDDDDENQQPCMKDKFQPPQVPEAVAQVPLVTPHPPPAEAVAQIPLAQHGITSVPPAMFQHPPAPAARAVAPAKLPLDLFVPPALDATRTLLGALPAPVLPPAHAPHLPPAPLMPPAPLLPPALQMPYAPVASMAPPSLPPMMAPHAMAKQGPPCADSRLVCQSLCSFKPYGPGMLQVQPGEQLEVLEHHGSGWCLCRSIQGCGWVPFWVLPPKPAQVPVMPGAAAVAAAVAALSAVTAAPAPVACSHGPTTSNAPGTKIPCAPAPSEQVHEVVLEFAATDPSFITLTKGELVEVLRRDAQGWVYGRKVGSSGGPAGWFPAWACAL